MLKFMRRSASSLGIKIIFGVLILVFMGWGVGISVGGDQTQLVAEVNGEKIYIGEYERGYYNLERIYREIYKERFDRNLIQQLNLRGQAVEQLVRAQLLRQEAEGIGLMVGDDELRRKIAETDAFHRDGSFDRDVYRRVLSANRLTPGQFEAAQREELLVNKLQDVIANGIRVTESEARDRFEYDNEKVNLSYVTISPDDFLDQAQADDAAIEGYFNANREEFRVPDRVRIEYALYPYEKLGESIEITPAEVEEYYQAHLDEFQQPEQVRARHILFRVETDTGEEEKKEIRSKAEALLAEARGGADFAELAKQHSQDSSNAADGGDLGFFPRGRMVPAFEEAAFTLEPGTISDLVETNFGLHIIKVEEKRPAGPQPLDQARDAIVGKLRLERAKALAKSKAEAAQAKTAEGQTVAAAVEADGVEVQTSPPVAADETIPGLPQGAPVLAVALTLDLEKAGPVVSVPDGEVVFRVSERIASHIPELAAVRGEVVDAVKRIEAEKLAQAKAAELLEQLKESRDLQALAAANGLEVKESGPITRASGGFIPGLGTHADLQKEIFRFTQEEPIGSKAFEIDKKQVLVVLKERIAADPDAFAQQKDSLIAQIEGRRRSDAISAFIEMLRDKATIEYGPAFADLEGAATAG